MTQCITCGKFITSVHHKCLPEWVVVFGKTVEEGMEWGKIIVRGYDAEDAAEEAAEKYDSDSGEYTIVKNQQETAWVRLNNSLDEWERYTVYGESVPSYTAYKDKDDI